MIVWCNFQNVFLTPKAKKEAVKQEVISSFFPKIYQEVHCRGLSSNGCFSAYTRLLKMLNSKRWQKIMWNLFQLICPKITHDNKHERKDPLIIMIIKLACMLSIYGLKLKIIQMRNKMNILKQARAREYPWYKGCSKKPCYGHYWLQSTCSNLQYYSFASNQLTNLYPSQPIIWK